MSTGPQGPWANPEVELALAAMAGRHSTAVIAAELSAQFSTPITRNAVIGKLHRAGLPRLPPHGAGVARPTLHRRPTTPPPAKPKPKVEPMLDRSAEATKAYGKACSIENVRGCRWPINDVPRGATFLFCDAPRATDSSYCERHKALSRG